MGGRRLRSSGEGCANAGGEGEEVLASDHMVLGSCECVFSRGRILIHIGCSCFSLSPPSPHFSKPPCHDTRILLTALTPSHRRPNSILTTTTRIRTLVLCPIPPCHGGWRDRWSGVCEVRIPEIDVPLMLTGATAGEHEQVRGSLRCSGEACCNICIIYILSLNLSPGICKSPSPSAAGSTNPISLFSPIGLVLAIGLIAEYIGPCHDAGITRLIKSQTSTHRHSSIQSIGTS